MFNLTYFQKHLAVLVKFKNFVTFSFIHSSFMSLLSSGRQSPSKKMTGYTLKSNHFEALKTKIIWKLTCVALQPISGLRPVEEDLSMSACLEHSASKACQDLKRDWKFQVSYGSYIESH
jgi:hypothetical protein